MSDPKVDKFTWNEDDVVIEHEGDGPTFQEMIDEHEKNKSKDDDED